MKKILKIVMYSIISLVVFIFLVALIMAILPTKSKTNHAGITPEEAAILRQNYPGAHNQFTTTDGEILFLWRWNPDSLTAAKKEIAVLLFPGITAYGGAYTMAGVPLSAGGYTTFGLDYRGHGLSGGNRGDAQGKERWVEDLTESVNYIKGLGFQK